MSSARRGERAVVLGFGDGCTVEDEGAGGPHGWLKGQGRDLGVRDGQGNHGEDHGRDSGGR